MERLWKNKRRKSLYDHESKDAGLLYRMVETEEKRITRSRFKKMHLELEEGEKMKDSTESNHHSRPAATVLSSVLPSDESSVMHTGSRMLHLDSQGKEKRLENFCQHFIRDLKKDLIGTVEDEALDNEEVNQAMSDLKHSLLSSDIFQQALEEPILVVPHHFQDLEHIKEAQQAKITKVCMELDQWRRIASGLVEDENQSITSASINTSTSNGEHCLLNNMRSYLSEQQQEMLDTISVEIPDVDEMKQRIKATDHLLKELRQQLMEEALSINKQLDDQTDIITSAQQYYTETPRTLLGQIKNIPQI